MNTYNSMRALFDGTNTKLPPLLLSARPVLTTAAALAGPPLAMLVACNETCCMALLKAEEFFKAFATLEEDKEATATEVPAAKAAAEEEGEAEVEAGITLAKAEQAAKEIISSLLLVAAKTLLRLL